METLAITSDTIAVVYYTIAPLLVLTSFILVFRYRRQLKQYENVFNNNSLEISNLQRQIFQQDTDIERESQRCARANLENTSSIRYAKRIQSAAFPQKEISTFFPESFIYTKAHSIVSGDFYKSAAIEHYKIFALADCSGHGVPGSFLTMLGLAALKEALAKHFYDENIDLANILDELREFVKSSLRSTDDNISTINDGMNFTLCAFENNGGGIRFAGANQNVYLYSNGELTTYNGDRMPIGWSFKGDAPFSETYIPVKKGDMLYLTTDSLQNQFGGEDNVKFSVKRLNAMFEQIGKMPISDQYTFVANTVDKWVEGHIQIDDLTVIGIMV